MAEKDDERRAVAPAQVTTQDVARALADLTRAPEGPTGPNATTDPEDPAAHYFLAADGETKVNAWGEEIGSKEAKQRNAARGL
jgi:hypothetical protein